MKTFLCIEDNEQFLMDAENLAQAQEDAAMYNGSVIRELTEQEAKEMKS